MSRHVLFTSVKENIDRMFASFLLILLLLSTAIEVVIDISNGIGIRAVNFRSRNSALEALGTGERNEIDTGLVALILKCD